MSNTVEILVPDIGDFNDVPIIEIPVAVGDTVSGEVLSQTFWNMGLLAKL